MKKQFVRILAVLAVLAINICVCFAQTRNSDAHINGHTINKTTGEHIPFVNVAIMGTTLGTSTDATGHFHIRNVPVGDYTIVASCVGYEKVEHTITVIAGVSVDVSFEMNENSFLLNQVVVSASRYETNRREAVSIVGAITPKLFEMTNSVCLADGLSFQPGLRVENNCQNCGFPQLRINGLEGPYTQILIDSRPINSALAGVYGLEHIPVNMVDRVEVVRGGASALFGSNAIGGTVNIITKETLTNSVTVNNTSSYMYGSAPDVTTNLNASVISDNNRAGVTLFASTRQREPFDYDKDGFSEIGKTNMKTVGFRGFFQTSNSSRLTLEYHAINEFRRGGNNFGRPPHEADIAEQTNHVIHSGGAKYNIFLKDARHTLQVYASAQNIDRESYYGVGQDPNAYGNTQDLSFVSGSQYTIRMNRLLFMPAIFIGGIEYSNNAMKDEMVGYNRIIDQTVGITSAFAQNEWSSQKASILLGGRMDKHSMIDNPVLSPRLSARFAPVKWLNLRGGFAAGYRGPQAFDEDLHVTAIGGGVALIQLAKGLEPEKSHTFTLSAEYSQSFQNAAFQLLAEGFHTSLNKVFVIEEIDRDADGNLILERRNGSGAVVAGINMEANFVTSKGFQVNAGYTIQSSLYKKPEQWSETVTPQRKMFRAPSNYGYVTTSATAMKRLDLSLSGTYTGSMLVQHFAGYISEDTETKTPSFFDLSCKIAYNFTLSGNITLQLNTGMKNIFNSFQKDFDKGEFRDAGYLYGPTLPRTFYFGLKTSF